MAKGDIKIVDTGGIGSVPTYRWQTDAGATDIKAGELCKLTSAGSPYALAFVDADLTLGTDSQFLGLAASDSTHTASVDGYVDIYMPIPNLIYEAKAKTAADVDMQAKIDLLKGDRKIIDVTSSVHTVDQGAADNVANALLIVGGDPTRGTLQFMIPKGMVNAVDGA